MAHAAFASPEGEATATSPAPEGVGVGYQLEASIASTYVFRGILQYGRLADPSSQNSATLRFDRLGPGSLSLSLWNATSLANFRENATASLEFDLGASYAVDLGPASPPASATRASYTLSMSRRSPMTPRMSCR